MLTLVWLAAVVAGFFALAYVNAAGWLWTGAIAVALGSAWGAHLVPLFVVGGAILAWVDVPQGQRAAREAEARAGLRDPDASRSSA